MQVVFDFPIEETKTLSVFNVSSGQAIFNDTLIGDTYTMDSLKYGIYLLTLSWESECLSVDEFRKLQPNNIDKSKMYTIQKLVFVYPEEDIYLHISDAGKFGSQLDLEEAILSKDKHFLPTVEILKGESSKLFEIYDAIVDQGKQEFFYKRDSLRKVLYNFNDLGDLAASREINNKINTLWDDEFKNSNLAKEIGYLKENKNSIVVPFILMYKIYDKETLSNYKSVLEELPEEFKNISFVKDLYRYDNF